MRNRQFKFTRGDIVHVARGLEWASPVLVKEERGEDVEILKAVAEESFGRTIKRYLVRSVKHPERKYWLGESFVRRSEEQKP